MSLERGRFAPSPSGPLHFGSLIAALGSFLAVRSQGGQWLVRIEDVDTPRSVPGAAEGILRVLERFGLTWDGTVVYQSQRTDYYQAALEHLEAAGLVYPCTCSRREIAQQSGGATGELIYPGTCRDGLSQTGRTPAIRIRTDAHPIRLVDRIQGVYQHCLESQVGDFVVRRADGLFAYHLAAVVDDATQQITQVVRGSDLLSSTPRQIYLQQCLGLPTPSYSHLPIAVDRQGNKLSKQTQALPLNERHPVFELFAALEFLDQRPPAELLRSTPAILIDWALAHWRPERIKAFSSKPWLASPCLHTDRSLHHHEEKASSLSGLG
ncbi:MAG: tRNA glutamyl-Q(34) synthetase GluQRS [Candidatus Competibacteraceae bacterium]